MKPFKKIAFAALAASVAGVALTAGLSASAQNGPASGNGGQEILRPGGERFAHMGERDGRGPGRGHHGGERDERRAERLFERFDTNSDGVITGDEIAEVRSQDFTTGDADSSGDISLEEFKAVFMTRSNDRMIRAFQFLDTNGDGAVTQEEADLTANRMFSMLDRDGNGTVERVRGPRGPGGPGGRAAEDDGERGPRADGERGPRADEERGPRAEAREQGGRGGPRGPHGHGGPGGPGGMFLGLFDADGDGSVTREDFDAKRAELFALADSDGSGSFSLEDFGPLWLKGNETRIVDMFQRADEDGSLGITAEEHDKRLDRLMEHADRNKDGVITKADFRGGRNGRGEGRERHHRG